MKKIFLYLVVFIGITGYSYAQIAKAIALLPVDTFLFKTSAKSVHSTSVEWITINGQSFNHAYRITTHAEASPSDFYLNYPIEASVQEGDILLLSFYTRSLQSKKETGESFMEIFLNRNIAGKYDWPPLFERGLSFGAQWVLTQIPFIAARDVLTGELSLVISCGKLAQAFELGGLSLVNYKQTTTLEKLPRSKVHYDGDEPEATWRKAAAERIEKYRKGNLTIKVVDKNGKPVRDAKIKASLKKSAFAWGTAVNSATVLDTVNPAFKTYRDTLLRYFNKVVFENEMKARNWAKANVNQTIKSVEWFNRYNIDVRGHVMVWPGWRNSPHLLQYQNDTSALRANILKTIEAQTSALKGRFKEWDVINEPFTNHDIIDSLGGKKVMLEWFNAARKNTEGVKLFLNDFTMFHTQGDGSENFYENVKYLIKNAAPIDAIGEQAHIGGTAPGIDFVLGRIDRFATFGLPIQITEFDITSDDDDFKSRYLKDFFTAIFSHPATIGIVQWGIWSEQHWIPAAALWSKDWSIRPEGRVFTELVTKTWGTNVEGATDKNGIFNTRGFNGEYEVVIKKGALKIIQKASLTMKGETIVVQLKS